MIKRAHSILIRIAFKSAIIVLAIISIITPWFNHEVLNEGSATLNYWITTFCFIFFDFYIIGIMINLISYKRKRIYRIIGIVGICICGFGYTGFILSVFGIAFLYRYQDPVIIYLRLGALFPFFILIIMIIEKVPILVRLLYKFEDEKTKVKILDITSKYSRIMIKEIAESCGTEIRNVRFILKEMIENNEIYAQFSEDSNMVEFDTEQNSKHIEELMNRYQSWEKNGQYKN